LAAIRKLVTGQYLILYRIVQTAKSWKYCDFGTGRRKTRACKAKKNDSRRRGVAQNASKVISGGQTGADTAADFRTLVLVAVGELQQIAIERRAKVGEFQRKHRTGLLTLLFTDIIDSTKLKQSLGDRERSR